MKIKIDSLLPDIGRRKKNAVIFDMDGVIIDNMSFHRKAWGLFLHKYSPHTDLQEFSSHFGKKNKDLFKILFGRSLSQREERRLGDEKEALYREIYSGHVKTISGLLSFLKKIKALGCSIAVATAAPRPNVEFIFEQVRLREYFHLVVDADDVEKGKPSPDIYLKTARLLGISPALCLVFEDSFSGIQAARSAGMKVIAVATTHQPEVFTQTDGVIRDFRGLNPEDLLSRLFPRTEP